MSLIPGSRLGPYEIVAAIGAGGMGEVHRGRDAKLNRDVAIKVLPAAFAKDSQRMARLQREAQVLAALNHPNIAQIYGMEGFALVMEFVPGETLQGPLPVDEALAIAKQIAEALEYAHEKGIIHRDLKPSNVKLTRDGVVKVLDFGLAKALEEGPAAQDISDSPTLSRAATQAGMILGTPAYMSPEQARGKTVGKGADIWAFGCVLYELFTGRKAFTGETLTDCSVAIMTKDPDWTLLPPDTPPRVADLLRHCLQKDARQRLQHIGDARWEMQQPAHIAAPPRAAAAPALRSKLVTVWVVGLLPGLLLATWIWLHRAPPPARAIARFSVTLAEAEQLSSGRVNPVSISADGSKLAYSVLKGGASQIYMRAMDRAEAGPIAGTEEGRSPSFSPNGKWLAFCAAGQVKKVPIEGGSPTTVANAVDDRGTAWIDDQTIVFSPDPTSGLFRVL